MQRNVKYICNDTEDEAKMDEKQSLEHTTSKWGTKDAHFDEITHKTSIQKSENLNKKSVN